MPSLLHLPGTAICTGKCFEMIDGMNESKRVTAICTEKFVETVNEIKRVNTEHGFMTPELWVMQLSACKEPHSLDSRATFASFRNAAAASAI